MDIVKAYELVLEDIRKREKTPVTGPLHRRVPSRIGGGRIVTKDEQKAAEERVAKARKLTSKMDDYERSLDRITNALGSGDKLELLITKGDGVQFKTGMMMSFQPIEGVPSRAAIDAVLNIVKTEQQKVIKEYTDL